jgi:hypothetical protein
LRAPWLFLAIVAALAVLELAAGAAGWLPRPVEGGVSIADDDPWYR